jgi:uncharacterized membrane protein YccC
MAVRGGRARSALGATLAIVGAVLLAHLLHLEMPVWAGISALRVFQGDSRKTLRRGLERIAGTVVGVSLGFGIVLAHAHPWLVQAAVCLTCGAALYIQAVSRYSYAFQLVGFTVPLIVFDGLANPAQAGGIAVARGCEVLVGTAVATLADAFSRHRPPGPPKPLLGPLDPTSLGYALVGGIAVGLVAPLSALTGRAMPGQASITAFIIVAAAHDGIGWKAMNRGVGCLLGAALGFAFILLVGHGGAAGVGTWSAWLIFLSAALFLLEQTDHGGSPIAYTGAQASLCLLLVSVQEPIPHLGIAPGLDRLAGIVIGTALVGLVALATWPARVRISAHLGHLEERHS